MSHGIETDKTASRFYYSHKFRKKNGFTDKSTKQGKLIDEANRSGRSQKAIA